MRACKPGPNLFIIDATAGWGRDAAILASYGSKVLMLERNTLLQDLLADAIDRSKKYNKYMDLSLERQDAIFYLESLQKDSYPDVIYLDPMHPQRQKTALVKKDMQVLHKLLEHENKDFIILLELALKRAKKVVVKWPQKQSSYLKPSRVINGKVIRFEIYDCFL